MRRTSEEISHRRTTDDVNLRCEQQFLLGLDWPLLRSAWYKTHIIAANSIQIDSIDSTGQSNPLTKKQKKAGQNNTRAEPLRFRLFTKIIFSACIDAQQLWYNDIMWLFTISIYLSCDRFWSLQYHNVTKTSKV